MTGWAGAAALMGVALAGTATAQEFRGAEISTELLAFGEGDDMTSSNYRGSLEMGVFGGIGVQADLSFYDLEDGDTVRNVTLHGIYNAFGLATVGGFYARETVDGTDAEVLGVEAARSFGPLDAQAYLGFGDSEGEGITLFGFDGAVEVMPGIAVTASAAAADLEAGGINRLSVGGEYRFGARGPALYAEAGRLGGEGSGFGDGSGFVGLGARLAIGPNQGTTFGSRGLFEVLGSF